MATLHLEARGAGALEGAFGVLTGAWQAGPWEAQTFVDICGGKRRGIQCQGGGRALPEVFGRHLQVSWGTSPSRDRFGSKGKVDAREHRGSGGRKGYLFLLGLWTWREAGSKIYEPLAGALQDFHAIHSARLLFFIS